MLRFPPSPPRSNRRRRMRSDETLISKLGDDHLSAPPVGYCLRSRRLSCFKACSPATEFRSFPVLDIFRRVPSAPRTKRRRLRCGIKLKGSPISKLEDDDLLLEILIRLPDPITAWRCKPVCKHWNSLVSTRYFKRRFVSHHQSKVRNAQELPLDLSSILSSIPLPDEIRPFCRILDCFKDLVLCGWLWEEKYINDELVRLYLVCNWFTKQWIALPLAPEMRDLRVGMVARLVCEPFSKNSDDNNLDTGDGQVFGLSSVYRFRVVSIYEVTKNATVLDVFCSESGKWVKEAVVLHGYHKFMLQNVISWDGKMWWSYYTRELEAGFFEFNPFRLDIPPTKIDISGGFAMSRSSNIAVSKGALYLASCNSVRNVLMVWRLEEDDGKRSWVIVYQVSLNNISKLKDMQVSMSRACDLHPENPEIVYLELYTGGPCMLRSSNSLGVVSFNVRNGELELVERRQCEHKPHYIVFHIQPRLFCWPTPIPSYEKLKGVYDGSYNCLVQSSKAATTPVPQELVIASA